MSHEPSIVLCPSPSLSLSAQEKLTVRKEIPPDAVKQGTGDGLDLILISDRDADISGLPGKPRIPVLTLKILLPFGKTVSAVRVEKSTQVSFERLNMAFGPPIVTPEQPIDLSSTRNAPHPDVYASSAPYPGKDFSLLSTQVLHGYHFALLNLFPVQYYPALRRAEC